MTTRLTHWFPVARWISVVLSPLTLPILGTLTVLFWGQSAEVFLARRVYAGILLLTVVVFTLMFPFLTLLAARWLGLVSSFDLSRPTERPLMYLAGMIYMAFSVRYLIQLPLLAPVFPASGLGGVCVLAVCMMINFGFKISVHGASAGALVALFLFAGHVTATDFTIPLSIASLAGGLIGFSRLLLGAHRPYQYYLGWICGLAAQWIGMIVYYKTVVL